MDTLRSALLVDDDPLARRTHQGRLEEDGYRVTVAADTGSALTLARQYLPNVIFLHTGRRESAGPFMQALRSDDSCRHIPVVILANHYDVLADRGLRRVGREHW